MNLNGTSTVVTVMPAIVPAAYADGDQIGVPLKIPNLLVQSGGTAAIDSLAILDKAKQKASMEILFFDQMPVTTSVDNSPLDISDAEMAAKFIGSVYIDTAGYADTVSNSYQTVVSLGLLVKGGLAPGIGAVGSRDIFMVCKSRGAPIYTSASDLVIKVGAFQD
jgi:hypothetical protein